MKQQFTYFSLVLTAFFWALTFSLNKYMVISTHPFDIGAYRFIIAISVLLVYIKFTEKINWKALRHNILPLLGMSATGVISFNLLVFYGLQHTSATNGALITSLNPAMTVILMAIITKKTISKMQIIGLICSLIGVTIVLLEGSLERFLALRFSSADLLILLSGLCWTIYTLIGRLWIKELSISQMSAFPMISAILVFLGLSLYSHQGIMPMPDMGVIWALLVVGILSTALGMIWWNSAVKKIGPARTAIFYNLVPIFSIFIALTQGQTLHSAQIIGTVITIFGIGLFSNAAKMN